MRFFTKASGDSSATERFRIESNGDAQFNGALYGKSVNAQYSNLYRWGGIFFTWDSDTYGTNIHHSIRSTYGNTYGDDLTINSFHHLRVNLDANNNNTDARFEIGHNTTSTDNLLFVVHENGKVGIGTDTSPLSTLEVQSDDGLYITTATNAPTDGAQIRFSDHSSQSQFGFIRYKHANQTVETEPVNSEDGFIIGGSENNTVVSIQGSLNVDGQTNFEGQVELDAGDLIVRSGTISANSYRAVLRDNSLENQATNGNSDIGINYYGYAGGTTQYRDLNIYDGKTNLIAQFDGSSGKVGIGVTSPGSKLQVNSTGTALARFFSTGNGDTHGLYININETAGGTAQDNNVHFASSGSNSGSFTFATGNDERMRIASNGKIGIGTIAPGARLHIIETTAGADIAKFRNNTDTADVTIKTSGEVAIVKGGAGDQLQLSANGTDNNGIRIKTDGYVGIGATNPSAKLDVEGAGIFNSDSGQRVLYLRQTSAGLGNIVQFQGASNQNVWEMVGRDSHFYIYNNDLSKYALYIEDSNNRIGINGHNTPSYELDVSGQIRAFGTTAKIWSENTGSGQASLELKNTEGHFRFITDNGGYSIYDQIDAAERFAIDTNGNSTIRGNLTVTSAYPRIFMTDTDSNSDYSIINGNGTFSIYDDTNGVMRMQINSSGDTTFSSGAVVATDYIYAHTNLLTKANVYLNYDNTAADSFVYFGDSGSDTAHYLKFEHGNQRFNMSNALRIADYIHASGNFITNQNLYLNYDNKMMLIYILVTKVVIPHTIYDLMSQHNNLVLQIES